MYNSQWPSHKKKTRLFLYDSSYDHFTSWVLPSLLHSSFSQSKNFFWPSPFSMFNISIDFRHPLEWLHGSSDCSSYFLWPMLSSHLSFSVILFLVSPSPLSKLFLASRSHLCHYSTVCASLPMTSGAHTPKIFTIANLTPLIVYSVTAAPSVIVKI